MSKLGVVHSGGKDLTSLGKKLCLRFMLDDYRKGNFFERRICDSTNWTKYAYLDKRTYKEQLDEAYKRGVEELFICFDTWGKDLSGLYYFIPYVLKYIRENYDFENVVVSVLNEPLERFTLSTIHSVYRYVSEIIGKYSFVKFAVGDMATNFVDFFKTLVNTNFSYDYISFHTDDNCQISSLEYFLGLFPESTEFINNEHYYFNGAEKLGYDHVGVVKQLEKYTNYMFYEPRIKSIYVCMPYHAQKGGKYNFLGLNKVDMKTGKVYETLAWKILKTIERKEENIVKLKELACNDRSVFVRCLQECLAKLYFYEGDIDGIFGLKTLDAVRRYNDAYKIKNRDTVSYETWYSLLTNTEVSNYVDKLLRMIELM